MVLDLLARQAKPSLPARPFVPTLLLPPSKLLSVCNAVLSAIGRCRDRAEVVKIGTKKLLRCNVLQHRSMKFHFSRVFVDQTFFPLFLQPWGIAQFQDFHW